MKRLVQKIVAMALAAAIGGCAGHHAEDPYAPLSEGNRDGLKAQRLTQEAAGIMDKNPKKAESLLREALAADLYHGPAHNDLGVVFLKQGHLYEAASEFEWARRLLPGLPDPRTNLALTLERAGRTDQALAEYASALEVYPEHLPTLEAMARLQIKSNKANGQTRHALQEIQLRGDERWREWARLELTRLAP